MNKVCVRNVVIGEGMPKICAPAVGRSREEILFQVKKLREAGPDLAEWRADWFEGTADKAQLREIMGLLRTELGEMPLLVTFRTKQEGGEREISAEDYEEFLGEVLASGQADLIDVELFTKEECVVHLVEFAHRHGVKVILSNHDWQATPTNEAMMIRLQAMQRMGADLVKLAVMPHDVQDVYRLLQVSSEYSADPNACPLISMAMGEMGFLSRLCGEMSGSIMTFATFTQASAPGQLEWRKMKHLLELFHEGYRGEAL